MVWTVGLLVQNFKSFFYKLVANGFSDELLVCPQLVRQYVRCDIIIASINNLAALKVRVFLIYLKLARLNLTLLHSFLICVLKERLESIITPKYLNCGTIVMFWPEIDMFDALLHCLFVKNIPFNVLTT